MKDGLRKAIDVVERRRDELEKIIKAHQSKGDLQIANSLLNKYLEDLEVLKRLFAVYDEHFPAETPSRSCEAASSATRERTT